MREQRQETKQNENNNTGVDNMTINDFIKKKFNELEERGVNITEHVKEVSDAVREEFDTFCTNAVVKSRNTSRGESYAIALAYVDEDGTTGTFEYKYRVKSEEDEGDSQDGDDDAEDEEEGGEDETDPEENATNEDEIGDEEVSDNGEK